MDGGGRRGQNVGSGGSACRQDDALGCWWEAVPPLCLFLRFALGGDDGEDRFRGVQPGRHVSQDALETQVVLWGRLGRLGKVDVYPTLEQDALALVRAKGEWGHDDSRGFDGNGLEEGQDIVAIVCDGVQRLNGGRLGGGLLCLKWIRFCFIGVNGDDAIVVIGLVCLACGILFLCPLCDGAGKNLEELARVQLAVEDCGLRQKWWEEDGVAQSPVPMLLRSREVAGGGAKEDFCDR